MLVVRGGGAAVTGEDDILYRWRLRRRMERAREESVRAPRRVSLDSRREQIQYRETFAHQSRVGFLEPAISSSDRHRSTQQADRQVEDQIATNLVSHQSEQQEVSPAAPPSVDNTGCLIQPARTTRAGSIDEVTVLGPRLSAPLHTVGHIEYAPVAPHTHLLCDIMSCHHIAAADRNRSAPLSPPINTPLIAAPAASCRQQLERNGQMVSHPMNSQQSERDHSIIDRKANQQHVPSTSSIGDHETTCRMGEASAFPEALVSDDDLATVFAQDEVLQSLLIREQRCQERLR